jgi:hypothetical protein
VRFRGKPLTAKTLVSVELLKNSPGETLVLGLERAGMRRTPEGARAMLDLRGVWIAGQWEAFQGCRIERDRDRLSPHRDLVAGEACFAGAPWRGGGYARSRGGGVGRRRGGDQGCRRPRFSRAGWACLAAR